MKVAKELEVFLQYIIILYNYIMYSILYNGLRAVLTNNSFHSREFCIDVETKK